MVTVDVTKLSAQLKQLKSDIEIRLIRMVQSWTYDISSYIIQDTPYGDDIANADLYEKRYDVWGLKPEAGLSRGSWVVSFDGNIPLQEIYGVESGSQAGYSIHNDMEYYNVGQTYYIGSSTPYVEKLNRGSSKQLEPGGFSRLQNEAVSIYNLNLKNYYDNAEGV